MASTPGARPLVSQPVQRRQAPLAFLGLVVALAVSQWHVFQVVAEFWSTHTYGHGYLVLAGSVWLAVRDWREAPPQLVTFALGWPVLMVFVAIMALMEILFLNGPRQFVLPLLFLAGVLTVLGPAAFNRVALPVLFVYAALPVWDYFIIALQSATTAIVDRLLDLTGVPALIEGNLVSIPAGTFEIAEGCSGLHYVIVSITLAAFYGLLNRRPLLKMVIVVLAAGVVALVANAIRVYVVILAGHLTDMSHYLVRVDHYVFGWILYSIFIVGFLWIVHRMACARPVESRKLLPEPQRLGGPIAAALVLTSAVFFTPWLVVSSDDVPPRSPETVAPLPKTIGGWVAGPTGSSGWQPVYDNAVVARQRYRRGGRTLEVYRAVYPEQNWSARLVRWDQTPLGTSLASVHESEVYLRDGDQGFNAVEATMRATLHGPRRLVVYWYEVGGDIATSSLEAKWREVYARLRGRSDAVVVAFSAECESDCEAEREMVRELAMDGRDALSWRY